MTWPHRTVAAVAILLVVHALPATAQSSPGCADLIQAAADGMTARIAADDEMIRPPQSVMTLTCLDGFFNGVGLNAITDLLNPSKLLNAAVARGLLQACSLAQNMWNQAIGAAQCGLTISGFNMGFGGFGIGGLCPRLSFGSGGPVIGSATLSPGMNPQTYIDGAAIGPVGYPLGTPYGRMPGR